MKLNIDWKRVLALLWQALKPALLAALGGGVVAVSSGCSALQLPSTKSQSSTILALGLPAIVITDGATQAAEYDGGDSNASTQVSAPKSLEK